MKNPVRIENIEALRWRQGIEDIELCDEVRRLAVGHVVLLTLLPGTDGCAGETVRARITAIAGRAFRGKLISRPISAGLEQLRAGSPVTFTAAHIHSVPKLQPARSR